MTAPRPYSEKPRWNEIGAVLVGGGILTLIVGVAARWELAETAGTLLASSGLIIRICANWVWGS